jgi:hypothetical protein
MSSIALKQPAAGRCRKGWQTGGGRYRSPQLGCRSSRKHSFIAPSLSEAHNRAPRRTRTLTLGRTMASTLLAYKKDGQFKMEMENPSAPGR